MQQNFLFTILISLICSQYLNSQSRIWGITSENNYSLPYNFYSFDENGDDFKIEFEYNKESSGCSPTGITLDSNYVFGLVRDGGKNGFGAIYKYEIDSNKIQYLADFNGDNGKNPIIKMTKALNGNFYGVIKTGGKYDKGIIYEFNPVNNKITKKIDFNGINGEFPHNPFTLSTNGNLYGLTNTGGQLGFGVLFEYNPNTNTLKTIHDFDKNSGLNPIGNLSISNGNKLYGMCKADTNSNYAGYIFEYNLDSESFILKHEFLNDSIQFGIPQTGFSDIQNGWLFGMLHNKNQPFFCYNIVEYNPLLDSIIYRIIGFNNDKEDDDIQVTQSGKKMLFFSSISKSLDIYSSNFNTHLLGYQISSHYIRHLCFGEPARYIAPGIEYKGGYLIPITNIGRYDVGILYNLDDSLYSRKTLINFENYTGVVALDEIIYNDYKTYTIFCEKGKYGAGCILEYDLISKTQTNYPIDSVNSGMAYLKPVKKDNKIYWISKNDSTYKTIIISFDLKSKAINTEYVFIDSLCSNFAQLILGKNNNLWALFQYGGPKDRGGILEYNTSKKQVVSIYHFEQDDYIVNGTTYFIEKDLGQFYVLSGYPMCSNSFTGLYRFNSYSKDFKKIILNDGNLDKYYPTDLLLNNNNLFFTGISSYGSKILSFDPIKDSVYRVDESSYFFTASLFSPNNKLYSMAGNTYSYYQTTENYLVEYDFEKGIYKEKKRFSNSEIGQHNFCLSLIPDIKRDKPENEKSFFTIYPNPTENNLTIETYNFSIINEIRIYNLGGGLLKAAKIENHEYNLNISDLQSGIYFIEVQTDSSVSTKKFIKI